jgi:hypothetical protein
MALGGFWLWESMSRTDAGEWNTSGRQGGRGSGLQGGSGFEHSLTGPGINRQHIGQ